MNKKQKEYFRYKIIQKVKHGSRSGPRIGYVKCWKGTSLNHFLVMCQIVWKLVNEGFEVLTEAEFNTKGRADILAIKDGMAYIIEVLSSETEEMFLAKKNYYPEECELIPVKVDGFDINKFEL